MGDASGEQWVKAAQRGDRAALEKLCQRHRARLLRVIRCRLDPRLRSRIDESDIVQETLAVAVRDLNGYQSQSGVPFFAWLRQVAWRQMLRASEHHIQAEKRTVLREQRWGENYLRPALAHALATNSTPSAKLTEEELATNVAAALDALSEMDREVLVLRFLEGLSTAESAAVLEISSAALRKRMMRALERLGPLLSSEEEVTAEG